MNLCDINCIKSLLARHDFKFSKNLGQNFLCDSSVPEMIAERSGADKDTCVLEVGPGIGTLTVCLCDHAKSVLSLEIDKRLIPILAETLAPFDNAKVICADILKSDLPAIVQEHFGSCRAIACANLPYYITTPAIEALIGAGCFDSVTVMVQKEVAERICASEGTKDYGSFTVYVRYHCEPRILFDVPSSCFIPRPKVDSAVVSLDVKKDGPGFFVQDEDIYFKTVKAAFVQRRKTLANALSSFFPALDKRQAVDIIKKCSLPEDIRGERLSPVDFAILSNELCKIV